MTSMAIVVEVVVKVAAMLVVLVVTALMLTIQSVPVTGISNFASEAVYNRLQRNKEMCLLKKKSIPRGVEKGPKIYYKRCSYRQAPLYIIRII